MPCAVAWLQLASCSETQSPSAKAARFRRPRPSHPSHPSLTPAASGSPAGDLKWGRRGSPRREPGPWSDPRAPVSASPPPPNPAPRDAVWSPDAPPGGAHGPPGLPVHGQPRRATRPGPRGHGARPQASSAPARPEPGPEPGPAGAHRPRAEPQVSGAQRGGGGPQDPQGRGGRGAGLAGARRNDQQGTSRPGWGALLGGGPRGHCSGSFVCPP